MSISSRVGLHARSLLTAVALASAVAACKGGGCGGGGAAGGAGSAASSAPDAEPSSPTAKLRPQLRTSGAAGALFRAIQGLDLREDQKVSLDKIAAAMSPAEHAGELDPRKEMKELHGVLVAGVKEGKIDRAKIDARLQSMDRATAARRQREMTALNDVHGMLEPAQRAAAAAKVRENESKREARMKAHDRPDRSDAGHLNMTRLKFEHYGKDLKLDAEQEKKFQAILPKDDAPARPREDTKKESEAILAAFEKDGFDARRFEPKESIDKRMAPFLETAAFFDKLLPILKPEQRTALAEMLEKAEDRRPGRFDRPRSARDEDDLD